jgi:hypothetical protein
VILLTAMLLHLSKEVIFLLLFIARIEILRELLADLFPIDGLPV